MRPLAAVLLLAAAARAAEPVEFKVEDRQGETLVVTEEERIDGKIRYEAVRGRSKADFGKRKSDFLSLKKWQYDQDAVKVEAEASTRERQFAVATKEELEDDGKTRKKTQFPHHGRRVTAAKTKEGMAVYVEGDPPEDGIQEQGWIDVAPRLLPKEPVAVGKEYEIDGKEVMKTWSRGVFDDKKASGSGKGKYQETVTYAKQKCAKLWVDFTMKGEGKDLPSMEMHLTGWVTYALEAKKILKLELAGPITLKMRVKDTPDIGDVDMTITGTMRENFTAEVFGK